jgi:hypothetical protein
MGRSGRWSALWRINAVLETDHRSAMVRNGIASLRTCSIVVRCGCLQIVHERGMSPPPSHQGCGQMGTDSGGTDVSCREASLLKLLF